MKKAKSQDCLDEGDISSSSHYLDDKKAKKSDKSIDGKMYKLSAEGFLYCVDSEEDDENENIRSQPPKLAPRRSLGKSVETLTSDTVGKKGNITEDLQQRGLIFPVGKKDVNLDQSKVSFK